MVLLLLVTDLLLPEALHLVVVALLLAHAGHLMAAIVTRMRIQVMTTSRPSLMSMLRLLVLLMRLLTMTLVEQMQARRISMYRPLYMRTPPLMLQLPLAPLLI